LLGIVHREATEQKAIYDRECRCSRPDADRKGADGGKREPNVPLDLSQCVPRIIQKVCDRLEREQLVAGLLDSGKIAELEVSESPRLDWRDPLRPVLLLEQLKMQF
jgi:hypothetical protein